VQWRVCAKQIKNNGRLGQSRVELRSHALSLMNQPRDLGLLKRLLAFLRVLTAEDRFTFSARFFASAIRSAWFVVARCLISRSSPVSAIDESPQFGSWHAFFVCRPGCLCGSYRSLGIFP
jgi:hypothetical protein